jgi:hypothetical protein
MANQYRIKFFREQSETTAEKADRFQLFRNNIFYYEYRKIKYAIKAIYKMEGAIPELENLQKNRDLIVRPHPDFITTGIVYTEKHGVRIEQKLAPKRGGFFTFFSKLKRQKNYNSISGNELA